MEEFTIPVVKTEPDTEKYPEAIFNDIFYYDNDMSINPIEIPNTIPYKAHQDHSTSLDGTLVKYPLAGTSPLSEGKWSYEGQPVNKGKLEEDMFIESLLDIDGLLDQRLALEETNSPPLPSQNVILDHSPPLPSQNVILDHSPSFPTQNITCDQSPPLPTQNIILGHTPPNVHSSAPHPVSDHEHSFGFLSEAVVDELFTPVTNAFCDTSSSDNLDQLVADLIGGEDLSLSNTVSPTIPVEAITIPSVPSNGPSRGEQYLHSLLGDLNEPLFEEPPPPAKRARGSWSSSSSLDSNQIPSSLSCDNSPVQHKPQDSDSPRSSTAHMDSAVPSPQKDTKSTEKHKAPPMLFGQHEDSILQKLLAPSLEICVKPITRDKLVSMPVEEFNALLDSADLSEIEVAFMKEWRRRGKNKTAAQIARKRKRDELSELQSEIDDLKQQRDLLQKRTDNIQSLVDSLKRKAQAAERSIYNKSGAAHGFLVSPDTHLIHITDDGNKVLVPRISSQPGLPAQVLIM